MTSDWETKMKAKLWMAAVMSFCMVVGTQAGATPILFNTGLGAQGTVDPNYILTDGSGTDPLIQYNSSGVKGNLIPTFWLPLPGAQWISPWIPNTDTDPWVSDNQGYTYVFRTTVGGTGTSLVSGRWITDDAAIMYVNGNPVAARGSWPTGSSTFSAILSAGDIVTFAINNAQNGAGYYGNPDGLIVSVPDGGLTATLLGMSMLAVGWFRRLVK